MRYSHLAATALVLLIAGRALADDDLDAGFLEFLGTLVPLTSSVEGTSETRWVGPDEMDAADAAFGDAVADAACEDCRQELKQ
ncbi:MAG TPA: hypothetical protein VLT59_12915 [Steroidobacteraceae bacterium]|nr:hypothetical protein [Steroidobacteraceae bacterium]